MLTWSDYHYHAEIEHKYQFIGNNNKYLFIVRLIKPNPDNPSGDRQISMHYLLYNSANDEFIEYTLRNLCMLNDGGTLIYTLEDNTLTIPHDLESGSGSGSGSGSENKPKFNDNELEEVKSTNYDRIVMKYLIQDYQLEKN